MPRDTKIIIKIILDFILLLIVGIPILIYHLHGRPTKRGFFCDDDSIRYPFRDSTVSSTALYIVGIFLPIIVISLNEFINETRAVREKRGQVFVLLGRPIPNVVWKIYKKIGIFLYGACMSQLTTDIAKYNIGRLRPHFIDVCNPTVNCTLETDPHKYQLDFTCLNTNDVHKLRESRLSFPSGHSSFSAYTMVYTVLYLQACMSLKTNRLLKPFLQFILLMMTWFTALSRVTDYKHHWSDVLTGFLLGTLVAIINALFVSDFFTKVKEKEEELQINDIVIDTPVSNYNTMTRTSADGV